MTDWTQRSRSFKGTDPADVHPYEDWEHATRPGTPAEPFWQPVHVRLLDHGTGFGHAAQALLDMLDTTAELALGEDAQRRLAQVVADEAAGTDPDPTLFLYRPEAMAYDVLADAQGRPLFRVQHVGIALPGTMVVDNPCAAASLAAATGTRTDIVLTAVIDDNIGVAHERFRTADGRTRVHRLWLQAVDGVEIRGSRPSVAIGQEFSKADIDTLLATTATEPAFYRALHRLARDRAGAPPRSVQAEGWFAETGHRRPAGAGDSHGTHVMDLAGGYPCETAPTDRPLVAVEVPALATLDTSGARLHSYALQALMRVLHWADTWPDPDTGQPVRVPVVVNFSFGVTAGPKNGTGFLEHEMAQLIDRRAAQGLPTKLVLPAGNNYADRLCAADIVDPGETAEIDWRVLPGDRSVSFLELRLPEDNEARLHLTCPDGSTATVPLDRPAVWEWRGGATPRGAIYVQPSPSVESLARVTIALAPTCSFTGRVRQAPAGCYRVAVENLSDRKSLDLWADVQRDDTPTGFPPYGWQSYLDDAGMGARDAETGGYEAPGPGSRIRREGTLSAFATARSENVFAVGGAFRTLPARAAGYTASGPTRGADPRNPALSAVTEDGRDPGGVLAAGPFSGGAAVVTGTSAAAPQVARGIVDLLAQSPGADRTAILQALTAGAPAASPARLGAGTLTAPGARRDRRHR